MLGLVFEAFTRLPEGHTANAQSQCNAGGLGGSSPTLSHTLALALRNLLVLGPFFFRGRLALDDGYLVELARTVVMG